MHSQNRLVLPIKHRWIAFKKDLNSPNINTIPLQNHIGQNNECTVNILVLEDAVIDQDKTVMKMLKVTSYMNSLKAIQYALYIGHYIYTSFTKVWGTILMIAKSSTKMLRP